MGSRMPVFNKEKEILQHYFLNKVEEKSTPISLLNGIGGTILIQSLLFEHTFNPEYKSLLNYNIDLLIKLIEEDDVLKPTFCDGLAGVGWLFLQLHRKQLIDINPDEFLMDLDDFLKSSLDNFLLKKNYDILHGAMGIGLYFLKRNSLDEVKKIVNDLYASCDKNSDELKLAIFDEGKSNQYIYNMGLAHGHASLLYFIGKCYDANILRGKCKTILSGVINFYFNNLQDPVKTGSFFCNVINANDYGLGIKNLFCSRLAWCYGDLGILYSILIVAKSLRDRALYDRVEEMLIVVSKRKSVDQCKLEDAQFCHGTSGVAYLFLKIYRITRNTIFMKTATYWKDVVIDMGRNKKLGLLGYQFNRGSYDYQPNDTLLCGIGGVLVTLLSFDEILIDDWDECMFLS
jgi:lantibiotic modifying enzyme